MIDDLVERARRTFRALRHRNYRLFFAGWYIALQVLVPGLLYHAIAAGIAARFAVALQRVRG